MEEAASHKIIRRDHVGAPAKHRERIVESRQFIGKAMWKLHWALVLISGLVITAYPQEFHATPLTDLKAGTYKGFEGGLYESGDNDIPGEHNQAGRERASEVRPLNAEGEPDPQGKIVFTSIGMSNSAVEFGAFMRFAAQNRGVEHSRLVIVNGSFGGMTACMWTVPEGPPPCSPHAGNEFDRVRENSLAPKGLAEKQVQIAWLLEANGGPGVLGWRPLCDPQVSGCANSKDKTDAVRYEQQLGEIVRAAKKRWPNLRIVFISSREYAGYAKTPVSPEPYAYEYGFSSKWFIHAQINQMRTGKIDPVAGDLDYLKGIAPWVVWGPYLWADGSNPRSDGLVWCNGQRTSPCKSETDFQEDGTHPTTVGTMKAGRLLLDYFLTSPYAKWFR